MTTLIIYLIAGWYYAKKETQVNRAIAGSEALKNFIFAVNFVFWPIFIVLSWLPTKNNITIL